MKTLVLFCLCLFCGSVAAEDNTSALLPMPNKVTQIKGKPLRVDGKKTSIFFNEPDLKFAAQSLQSIFKQRMEEDVRICESEKASIRLLIDPELDGEEHYKIRIDSKGMTIRGATSTAVFYGVMTMDQLLLGDVCSTLRKEMMPIDIDDAPRFPYRALMLDPARHFLSVESIKLYIDQMIRYKYNVLQLHLTDDQGWRMEIKSHPELASEEHYSQDQLKDIVQYAAQRNVKIIPELDIPGHTVALLAAHPDLGCTHTDTIPKIVGETVNLMLCANNEKVYDLYEDIIREVAQLFPSEYIHLGGDEAAVEKNWTVCDKCRALMDELGYDKASQLMIPFFDKMLGFVEDNGKKPILWCELDNIYPPANDYLFPYSKNTTLVTWRNGLTPKCLELTYQYGNKIIMAPGEYAYFDYPQYKGDLPEYNNWGMPITTLEKCYMLDPGYGRPEAEQSHILGVMGTLWGEAINDINRATYMTYPRGLALAEAGWTNMEQRDWNSFKNRIYPNLLNLMKCGISVRAPFEIAR